MRKKELFTSKKDLDNINSFIKNSLIQVKADWSRKQIHKTGVNKTTPVHPVELNTFNEVGITSRQLEGFKRRQDN